MSSNRNSIYLIGIIFLLIYFIGPLIGNILSFLVKAFLIGFPVYLIYNYFSDKKKKDERVKVNIDDFKQPEKVRVDRDGVVETEYKEREIDE